MARINIEDSIWKDFRFQELMIKVGGRHAAKGMIVELWTLAQEYWFPERRYVPIEKIREAGLQAVIDVGLAESREGGYFAIGTEKAFDWLFQKQEAGKKGGRPKRAKAGVKHPKADDNQAPSGTKRAKPSLLSSLPLSPSSDSSSISEEFFAGASSAVTAPTVVDPEKSPSATALSWRAYKAAYETRYGEPPTWNAKTAGQLRSFVNRVPAADAALVAAFYLTHNDAFYVKAMHPVGLLLRDAEKLRTEWATGRRMLGATARDVERMQHSSDVWDQAAAALREKRSDA